MSDETGSGVSMKHRMAITGKYAKGGSVKAAMNKDRAMEKPKSFKTTKASPQFVPDIVKKSKGGKVKPKC